LTINYIIGVVKTCDVIVKVIQESGGSPSLKAKHYIALPGITLTVGGGKYCPDNHVIDAVAVDISCIANRNA
jgi:hypothetical protein